MKKVDVECSYCNEVTHNVEIDETQVIDDSNSECVIISDEQRECSKCGRKWDEIELHYNKQHKFEFAYGK